MSCARNETVVSKSREALQPMWGLVSVSECHGCLNSLVRWSHRCVYDVMTTWRLSGPDKKQGNGLKSRSQRDILTAKVQACSWDLFYYHGFKKNQEIGEILGSDIQDHTFVASQLDTMKLQTFILLAVLLSFCSAAPVRTHLIFFLVSWPWLLRMCWWAPTALLVFY